MSDKDEIKELFQEKLGNYQAKVDPKLWQGVQSGLSSSAAAGTSLGIGAKIGIGALGAAVITAASIFVYSEFDGDDVEKSTADKTEKRIENHSQEETDQQSSSIDLNSNEKTVEKESVEDKQVLHEKQAPTEEKENPDETPSAPAEEVDEHTDTTAVPPVKLPEPKIEKDAPQTTAEREEINREKAPDEATEKEVLSWKLKPEIAEQENQYVQFRVSKGDVIDEIEWDFDDGHFSHQFDPEHFYSETGTYEVNVRATANNQTKESTISVNIEIEGQITRLPNTFTPNGDGQNDEFFIESKGLKDFQINVMNDDREIIYQSNREDFRWDGTALNGQPAPEGRYVYIIMAHDHKGNTINKYEELHIVR
ncbi:MAG: gliding motility-associated C-terminal domain-containing protein [Bacteroidota bacterium]